MVLRGDLRERVRFAAGADRGGGAGSAFFAFISSITCVMASGFNPPPSSAATAADPSNGTTRAARFASRRRLQYFMMGRIEKSSAMTNTIPKARAT